MNNLPAEVYQDIFCHLSRPDLQTCSFVCKRWNLLAVQVYSKELIIDFYKVQLAKSKLASDNAETFFKNGYLVQKLTLKPGDKEKMESFFGSRGPDNRENYPFIFSQAEFLHLLKYFPNIEELELVVSSNYSHYISLLLCANLQQIKKITAFQAKLQYGFRNHYQEYFITCFRFRDTLTSLYFEYAEFTGDFSCDGVGGFDMLSQFKNLKQLELFNGYSDNMVIFHILELCPQLTDLTYTTGDVRLGEVGQGPLEKKIEPAVKPNKSLRCLNIDLMSLPTDYTRYLKRYITDGLHTVNIRITSTGFYDCVEKVGMEDFLKLFRKLGQLNDACILFSQDRNSQIVRSKSKSAKWLQAADAFRGDKKILCTVKIRKSSSSQDYFKYKASDKRLVFAYVIENVTNHEIGNTVYDEREEVYSGMGYG